MDFGSVVGYIQSALVPLVTFVALLLFSVIRGRRAITSLILGLYFALLISLKFPYYQNIYSAVGFLNDTTLSIIIFAVFAVFSAMLMDRLLFYRIDETAFEGFGKKAVLAILGTVLIMAYSYHVLPVTGIIDPGTPAAMLFAPEEYFFWWLAGPLIVLFLMY
jgi:hypothetical protein